MNEEEIKEKKERIGKWIGENHNLAFLVMFGAIILVRLYYFWITKNQPLWWDESEYMSAAKSYAGIGEYSLGGGRLPGLPMLGAIFYIIGINNEAVIRFFLAFIPSIIVIGLAYYTIKEIYYNKKIAFVSLAIFAFLWEHLFYSNRFHTENLALMFELMAIFVMFRVIINNKSIWKINEKNGLWFMILFSALALVFRPGNVIFIPALAGFYIFVKNEGVFQNKIKIAFGGLVIAAVGILAYMKGYLSGFAYYYTANLKNPLGWNSLSVFGGFYNSAVSNIPDLLFYGLILGLGVLILDFTLVRKIKWRKNDHSDHIVRNQLGDVFNVLLVLVTLIFFIFLLRASTFEFRWFFPMIPAMIAITSKGLVTASEYIGAIVGNKKIGTAILIMVVVLGVYSSQWKVGDSIIRNKLDSYGPVKESGIWIKENSDKEDTFVSASMQHMYYSERKMYWFDLETGESAQKMTQEKFNERLMELRPRYIVASLFELGYTPSWIITQGNTPSGDFVINLEYFNSSIVSRNGAVISMNLKPEVTVEKMNFRLVYPTNAIDGAFIYEISYLD